MSKTIIVTELFYPDKTSTAHILTQIADALTDRFETEVICSEANYGNISALNGGENGETEKKPYPITKVRSGSYDKNSLIARTRNLCVNAWRLVWALNKRLRPGDRVVIVTNPAPLLLLTAILRKLRKFELTIIIHDVFPENAVAARLLKSDRGIIYRVLRAIFNKAYATADNLVVLGRDMEEVVRSKVARAKTPPNIRIIENWADENDRYDDTPSEAGAIRLLYAGNIGRCQGLEHFVKLFATVPGHNLQLNIRGGGAIENDLKKFIDEHACTNIHMGGAYHRDEQFDILRDCDIALITLANEMYGLGVPSKAYNILAAGKAILFIGDLRSEIARMVRENAIGYYFEPTDTEGLSRWLAALSADDKSAFAEMGRRARYLALTKYSRDEIIKKYYELLA